MKRWTRATSMLQLSIHMLHNTVDAAAWFDCQTSSQENKLNPIMLYLTMLRRTAVLQSCAQNVACFRTEVQKACAMRCDGWACGSSVFGTRSPLHHKVNNARLPCLNNTITGWLIVLFSEYLLFGCDSISRGATWVVNLSGTRTNQLLR